MALHKTLRNVMNLGSWLLAMALTILAVRFALVAFEPWAEAGDSKVRKAKTRPEPPPEVSSRPASAAAASAAAPTTDVIRTFLSVKHREQRSEVYVNGEMVGNTPYAGDLSCKSGDMVKVEIVPRKGAVVERSARCQNKLIEVHE
jgi:hypothetical protein